MIDLGISFIFLLLVIKLTRSVREQKHLWTVQVTLSIMKGYDYLTDYRKTEMVKGEVAVRLKRGKAIHTLGTIKTIDQDFDQQLDNLLAIANDRMTTLNAVE
jgi:hypothetical protein